MKRVDTSKLLFCVRIIIYFECTLVGSQNIFRVLRSLQGVMQQCHQLQKECEELKEATVAAETAGVVLKLREQELEKEARVNRRQLSELENQVL